MTGEPEQVLEQERIAAAMRIEKVVPNRTDFHACSQC